jgi:hypothetical protein
VFPATIGCPLVQNSHREVKEHGVFPNGDFGKIYGHVINALNHYKSKIHGLGVDVALFIIAFIPLPRCKM